MRILVLSLQELYQQLTTIYNVLPYVGSYIPSAIASGCLMTPTSGVAPGRLALPCGNRFGAPRLSWRAL